MPKFVCINDCYIDAYGTGKAVRYSPGMTVITEKCPPHFEPFGELDANLASDSASLIEASSYTNEDLVAHASAQWEEDIDPGLTRRQIIQKFVTIRENARQGEMVDPANMFPEIEE